MIPEVPYRYVAGLASGAAMAVVMAVAYSEDIAAAGAVAGLPYGEHACAVAHACFTGIAHQQLAASVEAMRAEQQAPEERRLVPLMVIHSTHDTVVPITNTRNLRDSWIAYYDAEPTSAGTEDCTAEGVACEHSRFADAAGRIVVETVFYDGPRFGRTHFWPAMARAGSPIPTARVHRSCCGASFGSMSSRRRPNRPSASAG